MSDKYKIDKQTTVKLSDYDPNDRNKRDREDCEKTMADLGVEMAVLQEWMYAARQHSLLVVLQGMDTSGKDGTIAKVMASVNPQGCAVASFKVPTELELAHDFLWRIHRQAPEKGMIAMFNRSHYEDVLVPRVHKLIDKKTCERRYADIRNFERLLVDNGTIVLKFFLHISKQEQEQRLMAREKDDEKAWKLSPSDWHERRYWDEYLEAYEDAMEATASKDAPWIVVPANYKWYRNTVIAQHVVEAMRPYQDDWKKYLSKLGQQRKAELAQIRAEDKRDRKKV
jgi:PPK2 family polyphosphate:nucleotide phosphotransferase